MVTEAYVKTLLEASEELAGLLDDYCAARSLIDPYFYDGFCSSDADIDNGLITFEKTWTEVWSYGGWEDHYECTIVSLDHLWSSSWETEVLTDVRERQLREREQKEKNARSLEAAQKARDLATLKALQEKYPDAHLNKGARTG